MMPMSETTGIAASDHMSVRKKAHIVVYACDERKLVNACGIKTLSPYKMWHHSGYLSDRKWNQYASVSSEATAMVAWS